MSKFTRHHYNPDTMTIKTIFLCFLFATISLSSKAQGQITIYKKLFAYSDSLLKTEKKGVISKETNKTLSILDKEHPAGFFDKSGNLLRSGKFNDAAFVYYVGYFRYRYFNLANPDYKQSEDGALLGSLKSVMGEPINLFLRSDIDNFIKILENTKVWLTNNDYKFFSKTKSIEKYNEELSQLDTLINDFSTNKQKYKAEWAKEQIETRKAISEMDNQKPKATLKRKSKAKKKS